MNRSDAAPIEYPPGLSQTERQHCRKMIVAVAGDCRFLDLAMVAASAGLDSTVLTHALSQASRIQPLNIRNDKLATTAIYVNHQLREKEVVREAEHVYSVSQGLTFRTPSQKVHLEPGSGIQARARSARYQVLLNQAVAHQNLYREVGILMAHNKNDQVETRLLQFLKGKPALGIPPKRSLGDNITLLRPFLRYSREDIERYARSFGLVWCEDSSNETDKYTRNKIRHHLIPWVKEHVNSGIIGTLGKSELICAEEYIYEEE